MSEVQTPKQGSAAGPTGSGILPLLTTAMPFGDYELLERIGQGGMGVVYKARQRSLNRLVAIKLLLFGPQASAAALKRFQAEAEATAALQHPSIATVHEVGCWEGQHFIAMDYVEGQPLSAFIRDSPLPARRAAGYLKTIAEAIQHAHEHGILHRDLKPANVLIDLNDQARVTDFGLARKLEGDSELTLTGQVLGSPNYIPPEQAMGKRGAVTRRSDVYALGAILYQALTGRPPFVGESMADTVRQVLNVAPAAPRALNPSVPVDLETVCLKCLEKEPAKRYATAQMLAEEMERFLEGKPVLARPVGVAGKAWRWCRRRPILAALGSALLISLLAGSLGVLWQLHQTRLANLMAERRDYANNIALAQGFINGRQFDRAADILNRRTLEQYRGWEWGWLQRQCNQDLMTLSGAGSMFAIFSPDSRLLATGGLFTNTFSLWDLQTGQRIRTFTGHMQVVGQVVFSPDGRSLASTGWWEPTVRIWEVATGRQLKVLPHPSGVYFASYSPDGKKLATACWDGKVRVWDTETWQISAESPQYGDELYCAEFSPDGRRIAYGGGFYKFADCRDTSVCIWDLASGELKRMKGHTAAVFRAVWRPPKGDLLASVAWDGLIKLWDPEKGREITTLKSSSGLGLLITAAFSPDGRKLAVAGDEGPSWVPRLEVFDVPTDVTTSRLYSTLDGHSRAVGSVHFSPNGQFIASAACDNTVKVWAAQPPPAFLSLEGHDQTVWTIAFSPDGRYLATGSLDLTAKIWNATNGAMMQSLPVDFPVVALAFNPSGDRLLTVGHNHTACIWKVTPAVPESGTQAPVGATGDEPLRLNGHNGSVLAVAWSPDGRWIATGGKDNLIILWEASTGRECRRFRGHTNQVLALAFSPDHCLLASGSEDTTVRLWNLDSGRCAQVLTNPHCPILSLAFSPHGRLLASGGEDGTARLWNLRTWSELHPLQVSASGVTGLAFSPDGCRLATAGGGRNLIADWSRESRIRLWDVVLGQELFAFTPHTNAVYAVAFSPDGVQLATASGDNTARLWTAFPWNSSDYPGEPRTAMADRIELYKRQRWRPPRQTAANLARRVESRISGSFNLPAPGSKTRPVFPIPARSPGTQPAQLDLTDCYNVALNEPWQPLDWVHDAGWGLATLTPGLQTVGGINFDIRGIVQLRRASPDCELFPLQVRIPTDSSFSRLHALHGTRWTVREGLPIAAFVLHYADGTEAELPVFYGLHVQDTPAEGHSDSAEAAVGVTAPQAGKAHTGQPRLFKTTFLNPHPERAVHHIEYVSKLTQSAPFLVALTVE